MIVSLSYVELLLGVLLMVRFKVVIGAASARHQNAAKAIIEGLAERHKYNGKEVHYIHVRLSLRILYRPAG
jgi:hypothetical protein